MVKKSLPIQNINWPGGQRDQGCVVVLHDHQEGYQPPITFRGGSSNIPQGVNEVSQV